MAKSSDTYTSNRRGILDPDYVEHTQLTDLIHRICVQQTCSRFPVIAIALDTQHPDRKAEYLKKEKKKKETCKHGTRQSYSMSVKYNKKKEAGGEFKSIKT